MRGRRKDYSPGRCKICLGPTKQMYKDQLCGKCYRKKKAEERQKRSISEPENW